MISAALAGGSEAMATSEKSDTIEDKNMVDDMNTNNVMFGEMLT